MYRIKSSSKYNVFLNDLKVMLHDSQWIEITNNQFQNSLLIESLKSLNLIVYEQFSDPRDNTNTGSDGGSSGSISIGDVLDDSIITTSKTWSSNKIETEITNHIGNGSGTWEGPLPDSIYTKDEVDTALAQKSNINHTHSQYEHINGDILNKFSESDNNLKYNGNIIYPAGNANINDLVIDQDSVWSSLKTNDILNTKAALDHIHPEYEHDNINVLSNLTDTGGNLLYNGIKVNVTIDDTQTTSDILWSSQQISNELATKSDINHTHQELHTHSNYDIIEQFNLSDNILTFNGTNVITKIDDANTATDTVWSSNNVSNQLDNKASITHTHPEYVHSNLTTLNKFSEQNGRPYYGSETLDGFKNLRVGDSILSGTAFELREGTNIKLDVNQNVVTISSIAGSGTTVESVQFMQLTQTGVVATSDSPVTIDVTPIVNTNFNYMPVDVLKWITDATVTPNGGYWNKAIHKTDYDWSYYSDVLLKVTFFNNGDYKICYGLDTTSAGTTTDTVYDGGAF